MCLPIYPISSVKSHIQINASLDYRLGLGGFEGLEANKRRVLNRGWGLLIEFQHYVWIVAASYLLYIFAKYVSE